MYQKFLLMYLLNVCFLSLNLKLSFTIIIIVIIKYSRFKYFNNYSSNLLLTVLRMSSASKSNKELNSPGFHLFFDHMSEVLTDENEVIEIVLEMWNQLDNYAHDWYSEEAMKNANNKQAGSESSEETIETISPGFQLFLTEMKSLVVDSEVVEETVRNWHKLDDFIKTFYNKIAQRREQKELKNKNVIENGTLLKNTSSQTSSISKIKSNSPQSKQRTDVVSPEVHKKTKSNGLEKEPLLQRLIAEKNEEDYERKTSKIECIFLNKSFYQ